MSNGRERGLQTLGKGRGKMANTYYDTLYGRRAYFIGDSLFGGHSLGRGGTWIGMLADKYGMEHTNLGVNGCTLSACEGGANPIIKRFCELPEEPCDFVVFEGGRNDYNKCAELGERGGDVSTYKGATSALIDGLRERYPEAVIIAVSFWKVGDRPNAAGVSCNEYTAAMREVCREMNVPLIDTTVAEESLIDMTNGELRREFCLVPGDVCHLNHRGMKRVLPFFERKIAEIIDNK